MFSPLVLVLTTALATSAGPVPSRALAAPAALDAPTRARPLQLSWGRDAAVTGGAALLLLSSELLFKGALAPETCRWCDRGTQGEDTLPDLDRWGTRLAGGAQAQRRARTWSDVVAAGMLPAGVFGTGYLVGRGSGASGAQLGEDTLIVAQAVLLSSLTNQVVKLAVARERPFVHAMTEEERRESEAPEDNNLSFYSGHSSFAFALVTSAGTVAHLRGYAHSEWIWAVGLPLAASVPLLRMAAGKHYLTDVAVGALMGSAFGVAVPLLLHPRLGAGDPGADGSNLSLSAGLGSVRLSGRF